MIKFSFFAVFRFHFYEFCETYMDLFKNFCGFLKTNVQLEFQIPAVGQEATNYNLMIASGDLCDIIHNSTGSYAYPDGLDAAVSDGYFLDLTDLIAEYAPNYQAARTRNEFLAKASTTDGGIQAAMYQIASREQGPFLGYGTVKPHKPRGGRISAAPSIDFIISRSPLPALAGKIH